MKTRIFHLFVVAAHFRSILVIGFSLAFCLSGYAQLSLSHAGSLSHGQGSMGPLLTSSSDVFVLGNYAYVASPNNNALEIVDVSNPAAPLHKSSLSHGDGGALLAGAHAVFVSGNYAFVAGSRALEIVDVTNPALPVHAGSLAHGAGGAILDGALAISVSGNYAYIVGWSNALEIVDVTNPVMPIHKGSLTHGSGGAMLSGSNSVFVNGNYAYVTSLLNDVLEIIDVSNPAAPFHSARITHGIGGAMLERPQSVYLSSHYAYVLSVGYNNISIEIVDVANPTVPLHKASLTIPTNGFTYVESDIVVEGQYAYFTDRSTNQLYVIDVSDPTMPTGAGVMVRGGVPEHYYTGSMYFANGKAYLTSINALEVIDISNPIAPSFVANLLASDEGAAMYWPFSVFVSGNYAYVSNPTTRSLEIADVSNPAQPIHKGSLSGGFDGTMFYTPGSPYSGSVYVSGNYAYTTSWYSNAMEIVNVTDPEHPIRTGSLINDEGGAMLSRPVGIFVLGNYAYVVGDALEIVNVTDPAHPFHQASIPGGGSSVFVAGNMAYIARNHSLEIVDVSNPSAPVHKGSIFDGDGGAMLQYPQSVHVSGNFAYIASYGSNALEIIDISDPSAPLHKGSIADGTGGAKMQYPSSVYVSGNYAFVAGLGTSSLEVIDITDPASPVHAVSFDSEAQGAVLALPRAVVVSGDYAYLVGSFNALEIVALNNSPRQNQTITFNDIPDVTVGDPDFSVSASASSGLPVSVKDASGKVQINGGDVTLVKAGRAVISAEQPGNSSFAPATQVTKSFCIHPAKPEIIAADLQTQVLSSTAPPGSQWYLNGVAIGISLDNNYAYTSSGNYTVQTMVDGCSSLMSNGFCIDPPKPEIVASTTETQTLDSSAPSGNQWYRNGAPVIGATQSTFQPLSSGAYSVQVIEGGCASEASNEFPMVVTGDLTSAQGHVVLFPNPTSDYIFVTGIQNPLSASIIDLLGRSCAIQLESQGDQLRGDIAQLAGGMYILRIEVGNTVHQIKFLKK